MDSGKELIYKVMQHQKTERVPWVPFTGVHAGILKHYKPKEVLTDADKLLESLLEVNRLYKPDGLPVCFDLQLEAEILGSELQWADNAPPAVISHPLKDTNEIPMRIINKDEGRLPIVFETLAKLKSEIGDKTAIYGLFCGPFTLASHLRGSDIFIDMLKNKEYVQKLVAWCTDIAISMIDNYIAGGVDVVAPVDPLISQISPKHFKQYCTEAYNRIFNHIRQKGAFSSFFVCGNAIKNIEVMCETGPDAISVDENLSMVEAKAITDRYNIAIGGNIPLTTVMLYGNQQDNMKYVVDLLDSVDNRNLIISPGCDMPYDVPVQNAIACGQAVHDLETARKLVEDYQKTDDDIEQIEIILPDYKNLEKPLVEIFTLDPVACAACTYMLAVWEEARQEIKDKATWGDYRYNRKEDIARMRKLGVKNLPSIYINGELRYDSLIPSSSELIDEIKK